MESSKRLNIILTAQVEVRLKSHAKQIGMNKSSYIQQSIKLYSYVKEYLEQNPDAKLVLSDKKGNTVKELVVF